MVMTMERGAYALWWGYANACTAACCVTHLTILLCSIVKIPPYQGIKAKHESNFFECACVRV